YGFGTEATAGLLLSAGVQVRREPVGRADLAGWVRRTPRSGVSGAAAFEVAPPRFDDDTLAAFAEMQSPVACECLRHMAEIVAQLGGFERYSQDCSSSGPADAALHRQLSRTAGIARTLFEQALQGVVMAEGLEVPDGAVG
ncbi:MAG: hypothetical protein ABIV63_19465, partial [Caldimonas sp.]